MLKDIGGIERGVVGYSKIADEDGDYLAKVEFVLKQIDLNLLRKWFDIDDKDPDPIVRDIIDPIKINNDKALKLQPFVKEGSIDIEKYDFYLHCWQAEGYDWSEGYGRKKDDIL